jgi:tripartite-type tricarboxylate transporter receptor subunit TctC
MNVRILTIVIAMFLGFAVFTADAQQSGPYPTQQIKIIAPTPPGSPPDLMARLLAERLGTVFAKGVAVENRPGASNTIGLNAVAKSAPDGYTLGILSMTAMVAPGLVAKMPYDTEKDLAPISLLVRDYNLLAVPAGSPVGSVADLVAAAKAKPGVLKFSSGGNGTPAHVAGELFKREAGIDIVQVPYEGAPAGVAALLSGDVDMMIGATGALSPHVKSGKLRVLAAAALKRIPGYPEVPTFSELGYSSIGSLNWLGIVTSTGTPTWVIDRLYAEIGKVLDVTEVRERLTSMGMEPSSMTPKEFGAFIRSESQRWGKLVRDAGIKPN